MTLMVVPIPPPRPPEGKAHWPNRETVITLTTIVANLACFRFRCTLTTTAAINLALRCISIYQIFSSKSYYKLPLHAGVFIILPMQGGRAFAVGLDVFSEVMNFYHLRKRNSSSKPYPDPSSLITRLDPSSFENACKILGLTPEEAKDPTQVESKYKRVLEELKKRHDKSNAFFKVPFGQMIDDTHAAYRTLCQSH